MFLLSEPEFAKKRIIKLNLIPVCGTIMADFKSVCQDGI